MRLIRLAPAGPVRHLQYAPDGQSLAAVVRGQVVRYDLATDAARPMPGPTAEDLFRVGAPAVSPDLRLVAERIAGLHDWDHVRLTDVGTDPPAVGWVGLPDAVVLAVGFAADGAVLLAGAAGKSDGAAAVHRWEVARLLAADDPAAAALPPLALGDQVPTCFADRGDVLAVGCPDGRAVLFAPGRPARTVDHDSAGPVEAVRFGPAGRLATLAGGRAVVWDAASGEAVARPGNLYDELVRLGGPFDDLAFAPDGGLLAVGGDAVRRFAPADLAPAERFAPGVGRLASVAVAPDGLTAAAGTSDGTVALWDL